MSTHFTGLAVETTTNSITKVYENGRLTKIVDHRTGGGTIYL
jgi:hypothetical protein